MPEPLQKPIEKPTYDAGHVPMGEEMDSARWTLPPIVPVAIAAAVQIPGRALRLYGDTAV